MCWFALAFLFKTQVVPKWLLGAWLSMTCLSWLGRLLFAHYADEVRVELDDLALHTCAHAPSALLQVKHPMFERLANESALVDHGRSWLICRSLLKSMSIHLGLQGTYITYSAIKAELNCPGEVLLLMSGWLACGFRS